MPLPPHTLKQFTMRDGRKGRLTPAVHVRHQHHLMQALQHAALMEAPIQELYPAERAFLRLLEHECQEHLPRRLWRAGPWPFDLYFEHGPLVVQCKRTTLHALTRLTVLQARHGVQGVLVDPHQKDFPSEHWVEVVRYTLQKETR
ncbi:hypothetical protein DC3_23220 [Deinococcus cellulosilyticus NBRC 106333 = KACC 11606]|uniref:DUF2726 domain-containing protein n=1 Tax=Deinococcus cellulosilyticus (strain DSM 18568 / NBRC 106333 / KACC 11606 / 5516J-15) TaxID=1223518 RepID=A0A511N2E7_DEIC1|nr:hypothetical protein DC3_23220 [Deinococcus cellulosilyticus NBRC 106333 = KACC 11606]